MMRERLVVLVNGLMAGLALVACLIAFQPTLAFATEETEEVTTCTASILYCCKCWYTYPGDGTLLKHCTKDTAGSFNTCAFTENAGYCPNAGTQQCDN